MTVVLMVLACVRLPAMVVVIVALAVCVAETCRCTDDGHYAYEHSDDSLFHIRRVLMSHAGSVIHYLIIVLAIVFCFRCKGSKKA